MKHGFQMTETIKNRVVSMLLCAAFVFLTGCASEESAQTVYESTTYIECSWWGNDARHQYTLQGLEQFSEDTEGRISVYSKYSSWGGYEKRMRIYMKSHNTPDVMQINYAWLQEYSPDGTGFYDLYELSDIIDLSNYTQEELEFGVVDGKLNAIPIAFNTSAFFYNQTLYESYGLETPETWDDLFAAARIMKKDGIYPIGMGEKQLFLLLVAYLEQTTGHEAVSEDGTLALTEDDIQYMLNFYGRMIDEKVLMPVDDFSVNEFSAGKTAGAVVWISDAGNYCDALKEAGSNVTVGQYLCDEDAQMFGWGVKPATMYAISSTTDHPEESAQLLDYLVNSEEMALLQQTEKGIPISNAARQALEEEELLDGYEKQADDVREEFSDQLEILAPVLENENVYQAFKDNADYYIYGKLSEEEVVENISEIYADY